MKSDQSDKFWNFITWIYTMSYHGIIRSSQTNFTSDQNVKQIDFFSCKFGVHWKGNMQTLAISYFANRQVFAFRVLYWSIFIEGPDLFF